MQRQTSSRSSPFTDDETGHCHINVNGRPCGKSRDEHQTFYEK